MDRTTNSKKKPHPKKGTPDQSSSHADAFTADMRMIVTRTRRNLWEDDQFDTVTTKADLPVFN